LKITPDARGAGLSGCMMAVSDDMSASYWNPAGLTQLDSNKVHLMVSQTQYTAASTLSFASAAYRLDKATVLGASILYFATPEMPVTTEFMPNGNGLTFRAFDVAAALTYSKILTSNFSFGITGKYIREQFAGVNAQNGALDFGFRYDIGKANTRFAVGMSNFGFSNDASGQIITETLSGKDTIVTFDKIAVPAVFRIGFAWDAIKNNLHMLTLAAQLNHPTDNNETYALGLEYQWHKMLFVRSGYSFAEDERGLPSFGFGLRFKRNFGMVQMDYGYQQKLLLGAMHRFGFMVSLF
jgi:long-subunit fatty acid transport protein